MRQVLRTHTLKPDGLTDEEFFAFCVANQDLRIERTSKGEILIMPPTGSETGIYDAGLTLEIGIWNRRTKLGKVFGSSAGFTLPNAAIRSPDVAWISQGRWEQVPENDRKKFAPVCPDFVAEIKSPSDSVIDLQEKMREWMANGCRLGWLLDPEQQLVWVYSSDQAAPAELPFGVIDGGTVLPGLVIDLNVVFEN